MNTDRPEILLPTAYLPPVEYMAWLVVSAKAEIEVHETYPKQTWRNRCSIPSANGPLALSIPVEKPLGNHTPTRFIRLSEHQPWQRQHWRSIVSAYSKSAFFIYYRDLLEPFFLGKAPELLVDWNMQLLNTLLRETGIRAEIALTTRFEPSPKEKIDLRKAISPKASKAKAERTELFPPYFQAFSERLGFIANQSIIDVLFNLGPDTQAYLKICGEKLLDQFRPG